MQISYEFEYFNLIFVLFLFKINRKQDQNECIL